MLLNWCFFCTAQLLRCVFDSKMYSSGRLFSICGSKWRFTHDVGASAAQGRKEKDINSVFAAMNSNNKLLQNGDDSRERRWRIRALQPCLSEVRGQNHQYVRHAGFLCGECVRPHRSAAPTTALRSRSPPGRSCCVWIASAAPWLQQTHNKLWYLDVTSLGGGRVSLASVQKVRDLFSAASPCTVYPQRKKVFFF